MERKIKKEIMDTSHDYTRSPKIKLEMSRSSISHDMSDSSSDSLDSDGLPSIGDGDSTDGLPSIGDGDSTDGENEVSMRSRPDTSQPQRQQTSNSKVLDDVVGSPEDFDIVEHPGPLTMRDINHDQEYYIFRFPAGLINPDDLVKTKFQVGSKEAHRIEVNKKTYEVSTYENNVMADTPTLFLPNASGQLGKVDLKISGHIVVKRPPLNTVESQQFNIDDLRSRIHKPPEIRQRNFFGSAGTNSASETVTPKRKLSKEEKRLLKEKRLSKGERSFAEEMGEKVTPGKKKRKSLGPNEISSPLLTSNMKIKKEKISSPLVTSNMKIKKEKISSPLITPNKKIKKEKE